MGRDTLSPGFLLDPTEQTGRPASGNQDCLSPNQSFHLGSEDSVHLGSCCGAPGSWQVAVMPESRVSSWRCVCTGPGDRAVRSAGHLGHSYF